ncbi:exodeoxyribonuclease III [Candidatus Tachikawaea gelatinosa]|uniref:Exodeoxyribonuclease III n=1 Tax=Candidatus Tachikawaea gelatinosa TaxID=1410383 RepID=A0A090AM93_9ENTR|nr:exodeoxyribonuclease III [Candidatus Tachikawaea gelatinosa]BAP58779.1 exodeoxyribonuclease III [Candidatus Tachikawaea gelatinosa]
MKFLSFNVNGLRARLNQLEQVISIHNPDVIGLQEIKVHDDVFPILDIKKLGYHSFFYGQKRYHGVALLTKNKPICILRGLPDDTIHTKRRLILVKIKSKIGIITIINAYFPNGENRKNIEKFTEKKNFFYRLKKFIEKNFSPNDFVLLMGDINVAINDKDIGISENNKKNWIKNGKCAFLPEEREWFASLVNWGFIDIWRSFNPDINNCFSWFSYSFNSFKKNQGLRIDLLLCSYPLYKFCKTTEMDYSFRAMIKTSDHIPIWADFSI